MAISRKVMKCQHCGAYLRLVSIMGRVVWKHPGVIKRHCERIRASKAVKAAALEAK